ncbi:Abi family protein [Saccharothrix sp. 6-C]|uniref:Abi family protein n=1 Tax=Saccharothrix sp. 6-C TaxID=2781735 RepID=UPI0019171F02|nr:Abi family protein [Saccharothrix sp. 6-C]QQQ76619.1 Abi family protein [Saccharothrix sp. 6-C]
MTAVGAGGWIEGWLSAPRFAVYLQAAGQDRRLAVELYEWNTAISSAFHHDLAHLEVGLRNAYDRALMRGVGPNGQHWVFQPHAFFPPQMKTASNGKRVDDNQKSRDQLNHAIQQATPARMTAAQPASGKVIAELSFGFWRYLTSRRQHQPLWVPYLHHAFVPGTARSTVDGHVDKLHRLRNRVAHHEPLTGLDLKDRYSRVLALAALIDPLLEVYISNNSPCPQLLAARPR